MIGEAFLKLLNQRVRNRGPGTVVLAGPGFCPEQGTAARVNAGTVDPQGGKRLPGGPELNAGRVDRDELKGEIGDLVGGGQHLSQVAGEVPQLRSRKPVIRLGFKSHGVRRSEVLAQSIQIAGVPTLFHGAACSRRGARVRLGQSARRERGLG